MNKYQAKLVIASFDLKGLIMKPSLPHMGQAYADEERGARRKMNLLIRRYFTRKATCKSKLGFFPAGVQQVLHRQAKGTVSFRISMRGISVPGVIKLPIDYQVTLKQAGIVFSGWPIGHIPIPYTRDIVKACY